jgi:GTPase SAR1 family protein
MGCTESTSKESDEKNKTIDKQLMEDRRLLENEIKLLLLGAGESGKSTIAKQMKIIHLDGFTEEEKLYYKSIIHNNSITAMRSLCQACKDLEIGISPESESLANTIMEQEQGGSLTPELADTIKRLWEDKGIREAFARSNEFQLNDSAGYYFDKMDEIVKPDYIPSDQDVLRSRAKTTGIIETKFEVGELRFRMVDVGGQRSERKKWMHCFQDVTAVIFCVALSEYDLKLYEDDSVNRMHESLKLFKEIVTNRWFTETATVLFLNKKDLFEEKIKKIDLTVCFPEYTGGNDFDAASGYIRDRFLELNENSKKIIYPHITCATDTENITHVFESVKDTIMRSVLEGDAVGL